MMESTAATKVDRQCSRCNHNNRPGIVFCEQCGRPLLAAAKLFAPSTRVMTPEEVKVLSQGPTGQLSDVFTIGRGSTFDQGMSLQLYLEKGEKAVSMVPPYGRPVILGRADPASQAQPDIDLNGVGGYARGLSRIHASVTLINHRVQIMDLDSSNGTYINDERIPARKPIELRIGDRLRLGKLDLKVVFSSVH